MVSDGQQIHRLNMASGFGNFVSEAQWGLHRLGNGRALVESSEYRSLQPAPTLATQSGPLLLHGGELNSHISPAGTSRLIRNGVGVVSTHEVVFVISEDPVDFYDFALIFR